MPKHDSDFADTRSLEPLALARRLLAFNKLRTEAFPDMHLVEPEWNMLLDLYIATVAEKPISMCSLAIASEISKSSALRLINSIMVGGNFSKHDDPLDGRRTFVQLTPDCLERLESLLRHIATLMGDAHDVQNHAPPPFKPEAGNRPGIPDLS